MSKHEPQPRLCAECERALIQAIELRKADWWYCPHARALAIAYLDAGAVVRWLIIGPTTAEDAHAQVYASAVGRVVALARSDAKGTA